MKCYLVEEFFIFRKVDLLMRCYLKNFILNCLKILVVIKWGSGINC